jgi:hypothetical protein
MQLTLVLKLDWVSGVDPLSADLVVARLQSPVL